MSARYSTLDLNTGKSDYSVWSPFGQRWYVANWPRDKPMNCYFAVVDDFGNLTEVDT